MKIGVISPQDWDLPVTESNADEPIVAVGASPAELARRIHHNTFDWLPRHFDEAAGAFYGFYRAPEHAFEPPQTVNLIAPWQPLAAYDRYGKRALLSMAREANEWFYRHFVESHPMSVVRGGVLESPTSRELWTKFTAEFVLTNLGLYRRTGKSEYLSRARQSAGFLIQSQRHDFAPKFEQESGRWQQLGWQSFGRVIEAFLETATVIGESTWEEHARSWGQLGLRLQANDGGYYLIDDDYFNTDIAADELRALTLLYELDRDESYLQAAERFANWLLRWQREDGAWPLTIDRDGNIVVPTVGPGDVPNIAMALLRLHAASGQPQYLAGAKRAFRYCLSVQVLPGSDVPYADDPNVQWGFWSWDPYYDYTLSGDQATHHIRGFMFLLDYLAQIGQLPP